MQIPVPEEVEVLSCLSRNKDYLFVANRTPRARRRRMKRKVQRRPVMSPCETKNVMSSRSGMLLSITAGSHQGVGWSISPEGAMIADIPVFAHRAMARRVSIALNEA